MTIFFKFYRATLVAVASMFLLAGHANAAGPIMEACAPEMETYCSNVTPGHGRLLACFYAHEDKISDACDAAIVDVADQIDLMFEAIRYVNQECGEDIAAQCAGTEFGGGRILSCLKQAGDKVSNGCQAVIGEFKLPAD